jgi:hypothetical protein
MGAINNKLKPMINQGFGDERFIDGGMFKAKDCQEYC